MKIPRDKLPANQLLGRPPGTCNDKHPAAEFYCFLPDGHDGDFHTAGLEDWPVEKKLTCNWCKELYDDRPDKLFHDCKKQVVGRAAMDKMQRSDDLDESTLFCPCGKSCTWSGADFDMYRFVLEHAPHTEEKPVRSFNGRKKERQRQALGDLYAAEAAFLSAVGWVPHVWNDIVLWSDPRDAPGGERLIRQEAAIVEAKKRITDDEDRHGVKRVREALAELVLLAGAKTGGRKKP
jgi:hypothetical protein